MGLPADNPECYRIGSILYGAQDLAGKLLLSHGTSDTNATISTTMRVVAALVEAGKDFDMVILPGQAHNYRGAARAEAIRGLAAFGEPEAVPVLIPFLKDDSAIVVAATRLALKRLYDGK